MVPRTTRAGPYCMNNDGHHNVPHHPSHCVSTAATPSLALIPGTMPFYVHYPQQQRGQSHLIRDAHVRPPLHIPDSRPSPHPGADQIPIAWRISVTLVAVVAVSFLALCLTAAAGRGRFRQSDGRRCCPTNLNLSSRRQTAPERSASDAKRTIDYFRFSCSTNSAPAVRRTDLVVEADLACARGLSVTIRCGDLPIAAATAGQVRTPAVPFSRQHFIHICFTCHDADIVSFCFY